MHKLKELLINNLSSGLMRHSVTTCSRWAIRYRVMGPPFPGAWSFKHHPWLKKPHDDDSEMVVIQKAAQMGFTEWALNKAFYHLDIHTENVLYVLPASTPDASDFSTSRFDAALEMSQHLNRLFSDVKNVGHKRAGNANLFIRGSRSKSQLKSIPSALLIFDELDEMVQENVQLAFERSSGQLEKQALLLSTPTIDNYGINKYFRSSSQDHYMFRCPCCNRLTELIFPECLVIIGEDPDSTKIQESYIQCKECKAKLPHEAKHTYLTGEWVSAYTDRITKGYHINQLYSSTVQPYEIARLWLKAQSNPEDEQEFYNSKLGLTHIVKGARITDAQIEQAMGSHRKGSTRGFVTMGVDVGGWLHYEIGLWIMGPKIKVIAQGKVRDFEELDNLMREYGILFCVIDANPERRKALEFAQRFYGRVRLCFYGNNVNGKEIHDRAEEHTVTVDRTSWMDLALGRFKNHSIILPIDTDLEYKDHIKAPVRVYEKDGNGNPVGKYVKGSEDDHYTHARTYNEIAFSLAASTAGAKDVDKVI